MGLIREIFGMFLGSEANRVKEVVEVFRPNAEASAVRSAEYNSAALSQLSTEFLDRGQRGAFDRFMDGVNRVPRPAMVLAVFALLAWTAADPIATAKIFTAWSIIPEPFWYVVLTIVAFYFGGRQQMKTNDLVTRMAGVATAVPTIVDAIEDLDELRPESPGSGSPGTDASLEIQAVEDAENPALSEWQSQ